MIGFILPIRNFDLNNIIAPIFFQQTPIITEDKSATYNSESPIGSSEPYAIYANSGAMNLNLTLKYTAVSHKYDYRWAAQQVERIKALVYPIYRRQKATVTDFSPPPMILLNYGHRYNNVPCRVLNYSYKANDESSLESVSYLPLDTEISLALQVSYPFGNAPGHDDIAGRYLDSDFYGSKAASFMPVSETTDLAVSLDEYTDVADADMRPRSSAGDRKENITLMNKQLYILGKNEKRASRSISATFSGN